jgi:hypothetical protein
MEPTNRMSAADAAKFRASVQGGQPAAKKASKRPRPRGGHKTERLIDPSHESREGGTIQIIEVPCYLAGANELIGWYKNNLDWLADKTRREARTKVIETLHRFLPEWCVDLTASELASGNAAKLRSQVNFIVLSRVSPDELDDDNAESALKGVRDTVTSWLKFGGFTMDVKVKGKSYKRWMIQNAEGKVSEFALSGIGHNDSGVFHAENNPRGDLQLAYMQTIRPATKYRQRTLTEMRAGVIAQKYQPGRYGVRIELHKRLPTE